MVRKNNFYSYLYLGVGAILFFLIFYFYDRVKFRLIVAKAQPFVKQPTEDNPVKGVYTWIIHTYPPRHNAGAEMMAHAMNTYLIREKQNNISVVLEEPQLEKYEQVKLYDSKEEYRIAPIICKSQLLLTQITYEPNAIKTAIVCKKPVVIVTHNTYRKKYIREFIRLLPKNIYIIHNSKWVQEYYKEFDIPSFVLYPPVYWKDYVIESTREYVTLINMNENKGGHIFLRLVQRMPDVQFLGVKGAYDPQILFEYPNLTLIDNTPYIKEVYGKTQILLMPSKYESWGRTAVEAMSSGIPVIAHRTPGLMESCGTAGIFCNRNDLDAWEREIRKLKTDEVYYKTKSDACKRRAIELDPEPQLEALSKWLEKIQWTNV